VSARIYKHHYQVQLQLHHEAFLKVLVLALATAVFAAPPSPQRTNGQSTDAATISLQYDEHLRQVRACFT
jgi:hypothetical protein